MARKRGTKLRGPLCALRKVPFLWGAGVPATGRRGRLFLRVARASRASADALLARGAGRGQGEGFGAAPGHGCLQLRAQLAALEGAKAWAGRGGAVPVLQPLDGHQLRAPGQPAAALAGGLRVLQAPPELGQTLHTQHELLLMT